MLQFYKKFISLCTIITSTLQVSSIQLYRDVNCICHLSVQIMFGICLADGVDCLLTSHWSVSAGTCRTTYDMASGEMSCNDLSLLILWFQWAWWVLSVDLGKEKEVIRFCRSIGGKLTF